MRRLFISFAILIAGFLVSASAAEYELMGVGSETCGRYAEVYRKSPEVAESAYFSWAQGLMSGLNLGSLAHGGTTKNLASLPLEEQKRALRQYCNDHPLAQYQEGVVVLFSRLPAMQQHQ
jgi:hypothetical protein